MITGDKRARLIRAHERCVKAALALGEAAGRHGKTQTKAESLDRAEAAFERAMATLEN